MPYYNVSHVREYTHTHTHISISDHWDFQSVENQFRKNLSLEIVILYRIFVPQNVQKNDNKNDLSDEEYLFRDDKKVKTAKGAFFITRRVESRHSSGKKIVIVSP